MRGYVDVPWGQVHFHRDGEQGPWVVLLHESPRTATVYRKVLPLLGRTTRAIAFDTPGFGGSDGPERDDHPLQDFASQLLHAIDALGVERFVPVGMKTGSRLATELALQAGTARVPAAVLYALEEFDPERAEYWATHWAPPIVPDADGSHLMRLWDKYLGIYGPESPRDLSESVGQILADPDRYATIYPAVFRYDAYAAAQKLIASGCAVTVFRPTGTRMTHDEGVTFAPLAGAREVTFPMSGHLGTRDPEGFSTAVLDVVAAAFPGKD